MSRCNVLGIAIVLGGWLGAPAISWADVESDLLGRFEKQNQDAGRDLVRAVEGGLAQASDSPLAKAERILAALRDQLVADTVLDRAQRDSLRRRVEDQLRSVRDQLEEVRRLDAARAAKERQLAIEQMKLAEENDKLAGKKSAAKQAVFVPQYTPVTNSASFQATPVASNDRMWVRIGISGTFSFFRPGPFR